MKFRHLLTLAALFLASALARAESPKPLTVFAAASLTETMQQLGDQFTKETGVPVRLSLAASSVLARQIEAGASVDVFVSADQEWMDDVDRHGLVDGATRRDLVSNRLALIAPADHDVQLKITPGFAIGRALGGGRLVTGDPDNVPVGRYAKQALTRLGVWDEVADRLVRAEDVRHALRFVARGECPLGIVYATDARVEPRVRVVDIFPANSHSPTTYPIAALKNAGPAAARFIEYALGDAGKQVFTDAGFCFCPALRAVQAAPAGSARQQLELL